MLSLESGLWSGLRGRAYCSLLEGCKLGSWQVSVGYDPSGKALEDFGSEQDAIADTVRGAQHTLVGLLPYDVLSTVSQGIVCNKALVKRTAKEKRRKLGEDCHAVHISE